MFSFDTLQTCYNFDVQNELRLSPSTMVRRFGATLSDFWRPIESDQMLWFSFSEAYREWWSIFQSPVNQSGLIKVKF